ncbi:hypothetical protein F5890DRAFT_1558275 [Lentinula detonsa]|uniref:Uncharacterized protein n=1 Tax=Lentinula detonsa TaxID=2804962 RepID=A0AA38UMT9_9AGAR|nr:hypothetical protein F5890DRAFT_1558275 [Lentinula detonsa]
MSPQPLQPAQTPDHPAKPDGEEEVGESQTRPPLMGVAFWFGYEEEEEFKVVGWEEECFNSQVLEKKMFHYTAAMNEDVHDEDWFPYPQLFTLPRVALRINAYGSLTEPEVHIPMESEEPNLNFEENEPRILPSESTPKSSTHPTASISAETESSQSAKDDAPKDGEDELTKTASLTEIHSWEELQEQVKSELASAKKRAMPLSQITQLLIIRNYVTL